MYCTQEFKSISLKMAHERRHVTSTIEKTKDHQCILCGKSFYNTNGLKSHMEYHRDTCDFECKECGNKYKSKSTLSNHVKRVHEKILPFHCGDCGKRFYTRGDKEKHESIHSKEKTFSCEICSKMFRRKDDVKKHLRIHSNVKPFCCKFCDKAFKQSPNMWTHMRKHHEDELLSQKQNSEVKMETHDFLPDPNFLESVLVSELRVNDGERVFVKEEPDD